MAVGLQPRKLTFIPALDGLRAFLIVMVFSHHVVFPHTYFDGARASVDGFFVISGFLIMTLIVNDYDANGRVRLKRFFRRRAYRLLPAVVALILGVLVYATVAYWLSGHGPGPTYKAMFYAAFYASNWAWSFGAKLPIEFIHMWTLSVEEQFYLLAPLAMAVALPRFRRTSIANGMFALCAVGIVWRGWLIHTHANRWHIRFGLDTHADALLLGCVLGVWYASGLMPKLFENLPYKKALGGAALVAFGAMTFVDLHNWRVEEWYMPAIWAAMAMVLVATCIGQRDGWHVRFLELPFLVHTGQISYPLYLWHLPVQFYVIRFIGWDAPIVLRALIAWPITYAVAELSTRLVERPAQRLRQRREDAARDRSIDTSDEPASTPERAVGATE